MKLNDLLFEELASDIYSGKIDNKNYDVIILAAPVRQFVGDLLSVVKTNDKFYDKMPYDEYMGKDNTNKLYRTFINSDNEKLSEFILNNVKNIKYGKESWFIPSSKQLELLISNHPRFKKMENEIILTSTFIRINENDILHPGIKVAQILSVDRKDKLKTKILVKNIKFFKQITNRLVLLREKPNNVMTQSTEKG